MKREKPESAYQQFHRECRGNQIMRRIWRIRSIYKAYSPLQYPNRPWLGYIPRVNRALQLVR